MPSVAVSIEVSENGRKAPHWDIDSDLNGEQTLASLLADIKGTLIAVAKEALREEQNDGFDKNPTIFVDNDPRKKLELVNPLGQIDIVARQDASKMLIDIYTAILKRSPVDTGWYYYSNIVYVNNLEVATNKEEFLNYLNANPTFQNKDQIRFVNIAPYARKLERHGISNGKVSPKENKKKDRRLLGSGKVYMPNGAYVLAARSVQSRYGKNAFIKFSFIDGGSLTGLTGANRTYKTDSGVESRKGKPYFYPTITVKIIESAILDSPGGNS